MSQQLYTWTIGLTSWFSCGGPRKPDNQQRVKICPGPLSRAAGSRPVRARPLNEFHDDPHAFSTRPVLSRVALCPRSHRSEESGFARSCSADRVARSAGLYEVFTVADVSDEQWRPRVHIRRPSVRLSITLPAAAVRLPGYGKKQSAGGLKANRTAPCKTQSVRV